MNREPYIDPEIKTEILTPEALCVNMGSPAVLTGQSIPNILTGGGGGGGGGGGLSGGIGDYGGSSGYGGSGGFGGSGSG